MSNQVNLARYRFAHDSDIADIMVINDQFEIRWDEERYREVFKFKIPMLLAFTEDDELIGYVAYLSCLSEGRVLNIAVNKKFQGNGFATQIMKFCLRELKDEGMRYVLLDVKTDNYPAISLYTKLDFHILCVRKDYYEYDGKVLGDAYFMQLVYY